MAAITGSGQAGRATHVGIGTTTAVQTGRAAATTGSTTIAGTVATARSRTTDRRGGHPTAGTLRATGVAEPRVVGGIGAALLVGWRIVAKDGRAPLGTGHILGEGAADAAQTEDAANGRGSDGFESLAA